MLYIFVAHSFKNIKPKIMKTLACADAGFTCDAVVTAGTEEEVLTIAAEHAQTVHGVSVTPEMAEQMRTLIKDE